MYGHMQYDLQSSRKQNGGQTNTTTNNGNTPERHMHNTKKNGDLLPQVS